MNGGEGGTTNTLLFHAGWGSATAYSGRGVPVESWTMTRYSPNSCVVLNVAITFRKLENAKMQ